MEVGQPLLGVTPEAFQAVDIHLPGRKGFAVIDPPCRDHDRAVKHFCPRLKRDTGNQPLRPANRHIARRRTGIHGKELTLSIVHR